MPAVGIALAQETALPGARNGTERQTMAQTAMTR